MDQLKDINLKRTHDLTIEEVKACKGCEHFTDEEAEHVISTIRSYTNIIFYLYSSKRHLAQNWMQKKEKELSLNNPNLKSVA